MMVEKRLFAWYSTEQDQPEGPPGLERNDDNAGAPRTSSTSEASVWHKGISLATGFQLRVSGVA